MTQKMQNSATVRVITKLTADELECSKLEGVTRVIDLRFDHSGKAQPVDEALVRRFANIQIDYKQSPLDLFDRHVAQKAFLPIIASDGQETLLIITDQVTCVTALCAAWRVKCTVANVETFVPALANSIERIAA